MRSAQGMVTGKIRNCRGGRSSGFALTESESLMRASARNSDRPDPASAPVPDGLTEEAAMRPWLHYGLTSYGPALTASGAREARVAPRRIRSGHWLTAITALPWATLDHRRSGWSCRRQHGLREMRKLPAGHGIVSLIPVATKSPNCLRNPLLNKPCTHYMPPQLPAVMLCLTDGTRRSDTRGPSR
jgi:hypothetical protein